MLASAGPTANPVVKALVLPVQRFIERESSSGIILIAAAALAFVWANSPLASGYFAMLEVPFGIGFGSWSLEKPLHLWVNDLLMALFFFLVGLEIKRELLVGDLAGWDKASLPAAAALGGMVVPAGIYAALTWGTPGVAGWGVPMATDIAFALGILALMGDRVPLSLKVFLLALAIVDDLGAVLVIAAFYTADLSIGALAISIGFWMLAVLYGMLYGQRPLVFLLIGAVVWYFMLKSGVHATIAGVLMALTVPLRHGMSVDEIKRELDLSNEREFEEVESRIEHLEEVLDRAHSPLHSMEHALQPYVSFLIMPVFAFFNAGVAIFGGGGGEISGNGAGGEGGSGLDMAIAGGVFLGLLLGKPLGVLGFVWLAVTSGLSRWPEGASWSGFLGIGLLAGIGFTMSLFIANLAFSGSADSLDSAKIGVLAASTIAAVAGLLFLRARLPKEDEAEARA